MAKCQCNFSEILEKNAGKRAPKESLPMKVSMKKKEKCKKKEKVFQKSQHPVDHKTVFGVVDM